MAISFTLIPSLRVPSVVAEFSSIRAQAGLNIQNIRVLAIGQRIATQVRATGTLVLAGQPAEGDQYLISDGTVAVTFEFEDARASGTLVLGGQPTDGDQFLINDGTTAVTFEFDSNASVVPSGTLRAVVIGADVAATLAALLAAVNAAPSFNITALAVTGGTTVTLRHDTPGTIGNVAITEPVNVSTFLSDTGMTGGTVPLVETDTLRRVDLGVDVAATAAALQTAINAAPGFLVTALTVTGGNTVTLRNDFAGSSGNVPITEPVNVSGFLSDTGMILGEYTAEGTADTLTPYLIGSAQEAANLWGEGSILHRQAIAFFLNNAFTELWGIALDDAVAGVKATGDITIIGPATVAGTLHLYVGGNRYPIEVAAGDSATVIAANMASAVNADTPAPYTASPAGGVVTFTAKNAGIVANTIDVRHSHNPGETLPTGVTVTINTFRGGAGAVDLASIFEAVGEEWFNIIISPYIGGTNLNALAVELEARWGPLRAVEAYGIAATTGTVTVAQGIANVSNSAHLSVIGTQGSPRWTVEYSAAVAAVVAFAVGIDPVLPFNGLELVGVEPPQVRDRWTQSQRNTALFNGVATSRVEEGGKVVIDRLVSTYRTNSIGASDIAFLDSNTHFTLSYLRFDITTLLKTRYPRAKLAQDSKKLDSGQSVVTVGSMRGELIARAGLWEAQGLVEDLDDFKSSLIVERNAMDPNRLDFQISPNLVNPLVVLAGKFTFVL